MCWLSTHMRTVSFRWLTVRLMPWVRAKQVLFRQYQQASVRHDRCGPFLVPILAVDHAPTADGKLVPGGTTLN